MSNLILSFITGSIVGVLFALLKLPMPAPESLVGVAGIAGITIAYMLIISYRI